MKSKWLTTFSWIRLTAYLNMVSALFIGLQMYTPCRASGAVSECGAMVAIAALLCAWRAKGVIGSWRNDLNILRAVAIVLLIANLITVH